MSKLKINSEVLPVAAPENIGGIKIGYEENDKNYPVLLEIDSKAFVNIPWIDTKNTAGAANSNAKLYLIGAPSLDINPQTYSNDKVYIDNEGYLYSNNSKTLTYDGDITQPLLMTDTHTSTHGIDYRSVYGYGDYDIIVSNPFSISDIKLYEHDTLVIRLLDGQRMVITPENMAITSDCFSYKIKIYLDKISTVHIQHLEFIKEVNSINEIFYIIKTLDLDDGSYSSELKEELFASDLCTSSTLDVDIVYTPTSGYVAYCVQTVYPSI